MIAMRLGPPPKGYANWTLRLLARKVVELEIVGVDQPRNGAADAEKNGMTNRKIEYWVIPPEADAEFVAHMEEVLETYAKPYDPTLSGALHGRAAGAVAEGDAHADPGHGEASPSASTTNTSGPARRASSCSPNRCPAGAR